MDNNNKTEYSIEDIMNAPKSSEPALEEAEFPCYGVRCVYKDGREVVKYYPGGMDDTKNIVYFSDIFPERCPKTFQGVMDILERYGVPYSFLKGTMDIWCRDYMPQQIYDHHFVLFGYKPDYLMDTEANRKTISDNMEVCDVNNIRNVHDCRNIQLDGGNVIRCGSKVIMTSKVLEENPGWTPLMLLQRLTDALAAEVILIPWDTEEIYGHADGILRAVSDDTVLMTNYSQIDPTMAERIRNALKPHFNVKELNYNVSTPFKNNWAYINWLQTDEVLILPKFNAQEDEQAFRQVEKLMPSYKGRIEMVDSTDLIVHEGCLNCASWVCYNYPGMDVL